MRRDTLILQSSRNNQNCNETSWLGAEDQSRLVGLRRKPVISRDAVPEGAQDDKCSAKHGGRKRDVFYFGKWTQYNYSISILYCCIDLYFVCIIVCHTEHSLMIIPFALVTLLGACHFVQAWWRVSMQGHLARVSWYKFLKGVALDPNPCWSNAQVIWPSRFVMATQASVTRDPVQYFAHALRSQYCCNKTLWIEIRLLYLMFWCAIHGGFRGYKWVYFIRHSEAWSGLVATSGWQFFVN